MERDGAVTLGNQDRWNRDIRLDRATGAVERLTAERPGRRAVDGLYVRRQRRFMALYRVDDRLVFRSGAHELDVGEIRVKRRTVGPMHRLEFADPAGRVALRCRYLDWELLRRGFIPAALDDTPFIEPEDFNWSMWIANVLSSDERRERIGRASA